jgi:hypothetical protein
MIVGTWQSVDDSLLSMTFSRSHFKEFYENEIGYGDYKLTLESCDSNYYDQRKHDLLFLTLVYTSHVPDKLCWELQTLTEQTLTAVTATAGRIYTFHKVTEKPSVANETE